MKTIGIGAVVLMLFVSAAAAAESTKFDPSPWRQGDQAYAFDATWTKQSGDSAFDLRGTWLRYAADNHRLGVNVLFLDVRLVPDGGGERGFGIGPSYEHLLPQFSKGRVFVGGDVSVLGDDLSDAASIAAAARVGYEFYVGDSAAVRFQLRWQTTIDDKDDAMAQEIQQYGFNVGIMLGKPKAVAVR